MIFYASGDAIAQPTEISTVKILLVIEFV